MIRESNTLIQQKAISFNIHYAFLVLLLIFVSACDDEKKEHSELQQIQFLEKNIHFPVNYQKCNFDQYAEIYDKIEQLDQHDIQLMSAINGLQVMGAQFELFYEKGNTSNLIWLVPGEYIPLDKSMVTVYANMLDQQLAPQLAESGIEYNRLEKKFISINQTKAIKIKLEQIYNGKSRFLTQYLISYKLKTFLLTVSNDKNIDYQFILRNF